MTLPGLVAAKNLGDVADQERAWDNLGSSVSADFPIASPSLDLDFATNKSLIDNVSGNNLITFSRASTGTFVGSNGLIQTAASGTPRFEHDYSGNSLGLLIEEQRVNTITNSNNALRCLRALAYTNAANISLGQAEIVSASPTSPDIIYISEIVPIDESSCYIWIAAIDGFPYNPATFTQDNINYYSINAAFDSGGFSPYNSVGDNSNFPVLSSTLGPDGLTNAWSTSAFVSNNHGGFDWNPSIPSSYSVFVKAGTTNLVRINNSYNDPNAWSTFDLITGNWTSQNGEFLHFATKLPNGWYRIGLSHPGTRSLYSRFEPIGGSILFWGVQYETPASFPASYIPTTGSQVTRAADVASITGANFSSWYNQNEGTLLGDFQSKAPGLGNEGLFALYASSSLSGNRISLRPGNSFATTNGVPQFSLGTTVLSAQTKLAWGLSTSTVYYKDGVFIGSAFSVELPIVDTAEIGAIEGSQLQINGTITRLTYYPVRLRNEALQYITSSSGSASSTTYPYSFSVEGADVLALNSVRQTSTRDFVFLKGLTSAAQPRLATAAQQATSGTVLQDAAMLKASPTTIGNYLFSSGITLSGVSTRINGTPALSIATSPFSGSTATTSILLRELQPQTNWRISEPMPSGTIASPELAIPFETNDFVLFMKAGQS